MDDGQHDDGFEHPLAVKNGCFFHVLVVFVSLLFCGAFYLGGLWLSYGAGQWGKLPGAIGAGLVPGFVGMGLATGLSTAIAGKFDRNSAIVGWLFVVVPLLVGIISIVPISAMTLGAAVLGAALATAMAPPVVKRVASRPRKASRGVSGGWDELFR